MESLGPLPTSVSQSSAFCPSNSLLSLLTNTDNGQRFLCSVMLFAFGLNMFLESDRDLHCISCG